MSIATCKFQVGCINRLELDDPMFESIWDALGFAVTWAGSVDLDRGQLPTLERGGLVKG